MCGFVFECVGVGGFFFSSGNETITISSVNSQQTEHKEAKKEKSILLLSIQKAAEYSLNLKSNSYNNKPNIIVLFSLTIQMVLWLR